MRDTECEMKRDRIRGEVDSRRRIVYKVQRITVLLGQTLCKHIDSISSTMELELAFSDIQGKILPRINWKADARCPFSNGNGLGCASDPHCGIWNLHRHLWVFDSESPEDVCTCRAEVGKSYSSDHAFRKPSYGSLTKVLDLEFSYMMRRSI